MTWEGVLIVCISYIKTMARIFNVIILGESGLVRTRR